jgi:hypothetical protein
MRQGNASNVGLRCGCAAAKPTYQYMAAAAKEA